MRIQSRVAQCSFLMFLALPGVVLAQPNITAFSFTPTSINTSANSAPVTVNFTLTDVGSGVSSIALGFIDPSGVFTQQGFKSFPPAASVTDSLVITFPRFSPQGVWNVQYVFLSDAAGNSLFLDGNGLAARGFPTALQVSSAVDNTPPNITAFSFSSASIDTSAASANVSVNYTLTDDLSGANFFQVVLTSPSGNQSQTASTSFAAATTVTNSAALTFPRFSEAGTWTVTSVFVADAAGNTLVLGTRDLIARGFTTTLTVTSASDTTAPTLTAFSFTPNSINVTGAPATVTVSFQLTDDLSGATTFQALFLSPSGATTQTAAATFAANTAVTGTATATFPKGSENGVWTVATVFLSDAAGNTRSLATSDLAGLGFPTQLTVANATGDTTPPVIVPTVSPAPNSFGWNTTTPVTVSWSVTDPESGINSSSGCGTSSVSAQTTGMTFTCSATNGAGLTTSVSVTVSIDLTPPIVTPSISPSPNAAGWNKSATTVSWTLTDPTSGIADSSAGCAVTTLTTETAGTVITCTATNGAGLSTTASVTVKIDATPPIAIATATPAPNAAGWNNTNVTVTFTGTDALSGIASCTSPVVLSTEGTGLSASGTCIDNAGNVSGTATASGIKIDKTAPVTTATPVAGALFPFVPLATVNASAVVKNTSGTTLGSINITCFDTQGLSVKLNSTDSGSGVKSLTYAATGGQTIASTTVNASSAQPSITASGLTTLTFAATDVAGNVEATKSESVLVGRADNFIGFACAAPTPASFVVPAHGSLIVSGTITSNGITLPFNQTITF